MTKFWFSNQKLTGQGFVIAWFGVLITFLGLILPDMKWLAWFGLVGTIIAIVLRQRAEHLKKVERAPRSVNSEQAAKILRSLEQAPKLPVSVGFFGQDLEAEQYAIQIKSLLEAAKFEVVRLEGFMVFKLQHGLELIAYNSDSVDPVAVGIRDAFLSAGLSIRIQRHSNKIEPAISLNVHGKPPPAH